jgi:hypothetical protein
LSYLQPPPMPAPVVVMKDVGGYVNEYQGQTEFYRASDREVRLHECRSACTLALSLPNVCVYPGSRLKFHLAYDPRNHQTNPEVSRQLFASYPPAIRARLGKLTRTYKVLRGSELIALGIRDCNEPRVMVASTAPRKAVPDQAELQPAGQGSIFGGLVRNVTSVFGGLAGNPEPAPDRVQMARQAAEKSAPPELATAEIPLPPPRPAGIAPTNGALELGDGRGSLGAESVADHAGIEAVATLPQPSRLANVGFSYDYRMARVTLPRVISGAQPILPARFTAYAELIR